MHKSCLYLQEGRHSVLIHLLQPRRRQLALALREYCHYAQKPRIIGDVNTNVLITTMQFRCRCLPFILFFFFLPSFFLFFYSLLPSHFLPLCLLLFLPFSFVSPFILLFYYIKYFIVSSLLYISKCFCISSIFRSNLKHRHRSQT